MRLRSRMLVFVLVASVGSFVTPTPATAVSPTQVTFVDAYAPSVGVTIPLEVCVDGVTTASLTTSVKGGPFPIAPGSHRIDAFDGPTTCDGTPTISSNLVVPAAAAATIVIGWGPGGPSIVVYPDAQDCLANGVARLVLRNAGNVSTAPTLWGARSGSDQTGALTAGAAYGKQASATVFAGTFTDFSAVVGAEVVTDFGTTMLAAGTVTEVYVYGGADGAPGAFSFVFPRATCGPDATAPGATTGADGPGPGPSSPRSAPSPAPPAVPIRTTKAPTYIG